MHWILLPKNSVGIPQNPAEFCINKTEFNEVVLAKELVKSYSSGLVKSRM